MTREEILAVCERHTQPMQRADINLVALMGEASEEALAALEHSIDHDDHTPEQASILWRRIVGMAATLDYGAPTQAQGSER